MESIPISEDGFRLVKKELENHKKARPEVIQAIKEAREEGDLKENAGYHAARERQGMLEARITYIESRMPSFNVIDLAKVQDEERALFGCTIVVEDIDTEEQKTFTIVGPDETDFVEGSISILSPVGRALMGKEEGDEILAKTPGGTREFEVLAIRNGDFA